MHDLKRESALNRSFEVLGQLSDASLSTPIEHLHICRKTTQRFKAYNINSLRELIGIAKAYHPGKVWENDRNELYGFWSSIELVMEEKMGKLAQSVFDGKINWVLFWESIGYEFTFGAAKLDEAFDFDEEINARDIDTLNIGKAVFILKDHGIITVGQLVARLSAGLPDYPGFGKNKLCQLAYGLRRFIGTIEPEGTTASLNVAQGEELTPTDVGYRGYLWYTARNRSRMSEQSKNLILSKIHLHKEISKLKRIGVENLDQLFELFETGLPDIRGIGKKARINLFNAVKFADLAITDSGDIDWDRFAKLAGMRVLPNPEIPLRNGEEFLASLGIVVTSLTTSCFDEIESATLIQRLIPAKKFTSTLECIGKKFNVTRERIRQKQEIVLNALSSALIDNDYEGINFRFTTQFSAYWRNAARHFGSKETLTYFDFITGLTEAWNVEEDQIRPHLQLIYAILTKDSKVPLEFNDNTFLPSEIFKIRSVHDLDRTIVSLHPSRSLAKYSEKRGVTKLGQLLVILRSDASQYSREALQKLYDEILSFLAKAVLPSGAVAWEIYYNLKNIRLLPVNDSGSPADFVGSLIDTASNFIRETTTTGRSEAIFIHRVAPDFAHRKTLDETGQLLGCSGPQIKREETVLFERLNSAIFKQDYTQSNVHFRDAFIRSWIKARHIIQQAKGSPSFADFLSIEWDVGRDDINKVVPFIASVIQGSPSLNNKKNQFFQISNTGGPIKVAHGQTAVSASSSTIIRLRGFRHVY